ncbi:hypothetical protein ACH5RR_013464 [Cinchona calisaya]|uniref:DUF7588 domain-containing protein n=1 Tax=Cinchona calisaya TaxID=153742 RepID=A0ABD3A3R9_9GENT
MTKTPVIDSVGNFDVITIDYQIDKQSIRKEFFAEHNQQKKQWFFENYKGQARQKIQDEFYGFLTRTQQHVQFFDWFIVYAEINNISYPFLPTINVSKTWQTQTGEVHSELPPPKPLLSSI